VAEFVHGVVHVLAHFEVSLTAACELVVKRMRQLGEFGLRRKMMGDAAEILCRAVVEEAPHPLANSDAPQFFAQTDVVGKLLLNFVPLGIAMRSIHRPLRFGVRFRLVHEVGYPRRDRLDQYLRAFALQELEHVEVAVAFGGLRPELAGDLYQRLHARAVDLNRVHLFPRRSEGVQIILAPHVLVPLSEDVEGVAKNLIALDLGLEPIGRALFDLEGLAIFEVLAQVVDHLVKHAIGLAFVHLIRANLVDQIVYYVAHMHGVQHAEAEVDRELQAGLARSGLDAVAILEKQHAEAVEAGVL
jgi:hypothetical protein